MDYYQSYWILKSNAPIFSGRRKYIISVVTKSLILKKGVTSLMESQCHLNKLGSDGTLSRAYAKLRPLKIHQFVLLSEDSIN